MGVTRELNYMAEIALEGRTHRDIVQVAAQEVGYTALYAQAVHEGQSAHGTGEGMDGGTSSYAI